MSSTESVNSKFRLHVSFAEADIEFVDSVLAALSQLDKFELSVTPGGQEDAKDWVEDAGRLIEAADAVVYILSPESVGFPTIAYEAEKASALSKRMVPIVCQPLRKADLPTALSGLRPVRMETEQLFNNNFRQLLRLLDKDANWIQLHTQLYLCARVWQDNDHDKALLLNHAEVATAKAWTFERSSDAPKPTDLHMEFIEASEAAPMGLQNGARRAPTPAVIQRARRKLKSASPLARIDEDIPRAEPPTPEFLFEPVEPEVSIQAADEAAVLPDNVGNVTLPATPVAATDDDGRSGSPRQNAAPVREAAHADAEEPIEPAAPAKKRTARAESLLGNLKVNPTAPVKASTKTQAKPPAKPIAVDLDTLAYVSASLKISRASSDRPCPAPAEAVSSPDIAMSKVPAAGPKTAAPNGIEKLATPPDNKAAGIKPAEEVAETTSPLPQTTVKPNASPLIDAPKPKTASRPHPVIIAQDELDGLLSSLMADADNDR